MSVLNAQGKVSDSAIESRRKQYQADGAFVDYLVWAGMREYALDVYGMLWIPGSSIFCIHAGFGMPLGLPEGAVQN